MSQNLPTLNRHVNYVARGSLDGKFPPKNRAAIVTDVYEDGTFGIIVLNPQGIFFDTVEFDPTKKPGTIHWPDRG